MGSLAEPTSGYVDFKAVGSAALGALDVMVPRILLGGYRKGRERIVPNPTRNNATPGSFSINLQTGIWAEFAPPAPLAVMAVVEVRVTMAPTMAMVSVVATPMAAVEAAALVAI
jgi:hypothetical protein